MTKLSVYNPRAHGADCDRCPLKGQRPVPPTLPSQPIKMIVVGMEPGFEEERQGAPFLGPSGKLFDKTLHKHDLDRKNVHVTNAALCRARKDEERPEALKCCAPRLQKELDGYDKKIPAVTMGAIAFAQVYGRKIAVTLARGFIWEKDAREIYPTVHPAFVLRDRTQTPIFMRDFARIAKRIHQGELVPEGPKSFMVPRKLDELLRLLAKFGRTVACDIETSEDQPTEAKLLCIGISDGHRTVVVPWIDPAFGPALKRFFASRRVVFHNGFAFDTIVLEKHGIPIPTKNLEDTLIAHHAFASHFPQRLDHLVSMYCDAEPWKIKFGKRGGKSEEKGLPKLLNNEEQLYRYNALDVFLTFRIWERIQGDLRSSWSLYLHDKEMADLCREMQMNGIFVDQQKKEELSRDIKTKEVRLYGEMVEIIGHEFAPTKTKELRTILFQELKAPILERTEKTNTPSTGKKVLQALAEDQTRVFGAFCKKLIELRACSKMRVTYLDNLHVEADGRVRASWRSFGTPTGRLAVRRPNLQNLKRPDKRFKKEPEQQIRTIYTASPGNVFVGYDMSQVEQRIAAYLSGDLNFIDSVESGDMHTANALKLFGPLPEILALKTDKDGPGKYWRDVAKTAGFAVNYLAEAETVWKKLRSEGYDIKLSKVIDMINTLRKEFRGYYAFVEKNTTFCQKHGYIQVGFLSGRLRHIGFAPEPSKVANGPIQGGAADVMNNMLLRIHKRVKKETKAKLVSQVHDAGIFDCPPKDVAKVKQIIKEEAGKPWTINTRTVYLPVDSKEGFRFNEAA